MDTERVYSISELVIHHSLGKEFKNATALEIQDAFDHYGREWGYLHYSQKYGVPLDVLKTGHLHPARDQQTFAQAHYALHEYAKSDTGWRLVLLMRDAFGSVAWHADQSCAGPVFNIGPVNCRSIGIEVCGDYRMKQLPEEALFTIARGFVDHAKNLSANKGMKLGISGHKDYANTDCPGLIYDQLPHLREILAGLM